MVTGTIFFAPPANGESRSQCGVRAEKIVTDTIFPIFSHARARE
jgi:hypothetical protein